MQLRCVIPVRFYNIVCESLDCNFSDIFSRNNNINDFALGLCCSVYIIWLKNCVAVVVHIIILLCDIVYSSETITVEWAVLIKPGLMAFYLQLDKEFECKLIK